MRGTPGRRQSNHGLPGRALLVCLGFWLAATPGGARPLSFYPSPWETVRQELRPRLTLQKAPCAPDAAPSPAAKENHPLPFDRERDDAPEERPSPAAKENHPLPSPSPLPRKRPVLRDPSILAGRKDMISSEQVLPAASSPEAAPPSPPPAPEKQASSAAAPGPPPRKESPGEPTPSAPAAFFPRSFVAGIGRASATFGLQLAERAPSSRRASEDGLGAAGSPGVRRFQLGLTQLPVGGGKLQVNWLHLAGEDLSRTAQRFSLQVDGRRLKLEGLFQESDPRLANDPTLSSEDRKLLGASWGSRRQSLTAGYTLGNAGSLGATWLRLDDSRGRLSRQRLGWDGPRGARIAFDWGEADTGFARLNDLPEGERADVKQRQGQRWRDLSARLQLTSWLFTENLWSRWHSLQEDRARQRSRQQWTLLPTRGATITWLRDTTTQRSGKQSATTTLQSLKVEQKLRALTLNWGRDVTTRSGGGRAQRTVTESLSLAQNFSALSLAAALETTNTQGKERARRLSLRLALPNPPENSGRAPAPIAGTVDYTALRLPGDRSEQSGRLDLATRLPLLASLKFEGKRQTQGRQENEQWKAEARGQLSSRFPWLVTVAQTYSDRAGGRRDLTLSLLPPPAKGAAPPRLSFWLARSEALVPEALGAAAPGTPPPTQAALLMQEHAVGPVAVALGLAQTAAGGDSRLGLAYDVRTDPKRPLQFELSRRLVAAGKADAPLLQREALLLRPSGGWQIALARERLALATSRGLVSGEARWVWEVGRRTSGWQWSIGGGDQIAPDGRRVGLATRWNVQGEIRPGAKLRFAYDGFPALPGPDGLRERLTATLQYHIDSRLSLDFQGTWLRRHKKPDPEPIWRLDLNASF